MHLYRSELTMGEYAEIYEAAYNSKSTRSLRSHANRNALFNRLVAEKIAEKRAARNAAIEARDRRCA